MSPAAMFHHHLSGANRRAGERRIQQFGCSPSRVCRHRDWGMGILAARVTLYCQTSFLYLGSRKLDCNCKKLQRPCRQAETGAFLPVRSDNENEGKTKWQ